MLKVLLQIDKFECPCSGKKIEDALVEQKGVLSVRAFPKLGRVRTELNEKELNGEQLENIMNDLGYEVQSRKEEYTL